MVAVPDEIENVSSQFCTGCGRDLSDVEGELDYVMQEIDLPPITPIYRERRFYKKVCTCGCCNRDYAPRKRGGNAITFGKNIRAAATYLSVVQCMPYERLQSLFETMFNVRISQGTLANIVREMLDKSRPAIGLIERLIKESAVVGFDESGCYVNGRLNWSWIAQTTYLTLVFRGSGRGARVLEERFGDSLKNMIAVTDRHSAYFDRLPRQPGMSGPSFTESGIPQRHRQGTGMGKRGADAPAGGYPSAKREPRRDNPERELAHKA